MVIQRSESLYIILGVLALGTSVRADMRPVSSPDAGCQQAVRASVATAPRGMDFSNPLDCLSIASLGSLPVESLPHLHGGMGRAGELPPAQIQSDGQNSFGLCLYALLGLGMCRSVPLVKRLSFSHVPQWYHDGGPVQIGHSHAISPDCLCHAPVCFVQPECRAGDITSSYRQETIVALWRQSQFTPAVLASRGPPDLAHE